MLNYRRVSLVSAGVSRIRAVTHDHAVIGQLLAVQRGAPPAQGVLRRSAATIRDWVGALRIHRAGATALEFAIVAPILIPILLGIVELGLLFITNVCLDVATGSFATQIRTGQLQAPGLAATSSSGPQMDLADAKTWICRMIPVATLASCVSQLQLDVRPLPSYQQAAATSPISNNQFTSSSLCYYSGNAGALVEIRAYYLYSLIDPLLTATFANVTSYQGASGHFFPIMTTQVFLSEAYATAANTGAGC